jgi:hypothetical protein
MAPTMLAYNLTSTLNTTFVPTIGIGQGTDHQLLTPGAPLDNSYWFCILDAKNPYQKVNELIVPGANNSVVPPALDAYMKNPSVIVALLTQNLRCTQVPQGALYNLLVSHGAGRELQRLEQLNATRGCGSAFSVSYVLTTQGGANFGYEKGSETERVRYLMSLMSNFGVYTLCDTYTF